MTIKHLSIFITVAEELSITKAAKILYLAQPAVSLYISQLESHYNVQLFIRDKQRIKLTNDGKKLLSYAYKVINSFNDFEQIAFNTSTSVNINLGSSLSIGEMIFPKLISLFENENKYSFTYKVSTSDDIIKLVHDGVLDLAMVETPIIDKTLEIIHLYDDELCLVCANSYPVDDEIQLEDLPNYNLLLRNKDSGTRATFDNVLDLHGLKVVPKCEALTNQSLIEFALNNLGIEVIPSSLIQEKKDSNLIKIVRIKDISFTRPISLIFNKNNSSILKCSDLINYFKDINKKLQ